MKDSVSNAENLIINTSSQQYRGINPPYQVDSRLSSNPCFGTTHIEHYTQHNTHKYSKVQSRYKTCPKSARSMKDNYDME